MNHESSMKNPRSLTASLPLKIRRERKTSKGFLLGETVTFQGRTVYIYRDGWIRWIFMGIFRLLYMQSSHGSCTVGFLFQTFWRNLKKMADALQVDIAPLASWLVLHCFTWATQVCFRHPFFSHVRALVLAFSETLQYWYQTVHLGNVWNLANQHPCSISAEIWWHWDITHLPFKIAAKSKSSSAGISSCTPSTVV